MSAPVRRPAGAESELAFTVTRGVVHTAAFTREVAR